MSVEVLKKFSGTSSGAGGSFEAVYFKLPPNFLANFLQSESIFGLGTLPDKVGIPLQRKFAKTSEKACVEKLLFGPGSPGKVSTKLHLFRFDFVVNFCPRGQFMFAHEVNMKQTNFAYKVKLQS